MATVDDAEAFKALAHPLRVRILQHLNTHGSATASELGALLGTTSGTTSYHLRRLERHGFVEDDPEHGSRRERWWRWPGGQDRQRVVFAQPDELDDATRTAAAAADRVLFAYDREVLDRFVAHYRELGPWATGVRAGRHMTTDQLAAFTADFRALLDRHGSRRQDASPDARPVELRFFALPTDEGT